MRGIPAAELPHLFDRQYQARQSSRSVASATSEEGKGLGMIIFKRDRGEVAVQSTVGYGTTVALQFPA